MDLHHLSLVSFSSPCNLTLDFLQGFFAISLVNQKWAIGKKIEGESKTVIRFLYGPQEAGVKHAMVLVQADRGLLSEYLGTLAASSLNSLVAVGSLINFLTPFGFVTVYFLSSF